MAEKDDEKQADSDEESDKKKNPYMEENDQVQGNNPRGRGIDADERSNGQG